VHEHSRVMDPRDELAFSQFGACSLSDERSYRFRASPSLTLGAPFPYFSLGPVYALAPAPRRPLIGRTNYFPTGPGSFLRRVRLDCHGVCSTDGGHPFVERGALVLRTGSARPFALARAGLASGQRGRRLCSRPPTAAARILGPSDPT